MADEANSGDSRDQAKSGPSQSGQQEFIKQVQPSEQEQQGTAKQQPASGTPPPSFPPITVINNVPTGGDGVKWTDIAIVILTAGIVVAAIIQTLIFKKQWQEMHQGGNDTHDLAVAAGKQADRMQDFADRMKDQSERTKELADRMKEQADNTFTLGQTAQTANAIAKTASNAVQRAFIVVDKLDISSFRKPNGEVDRWIVNPVVTNSGNTPTVNLYFGISFGNPKADMTQWPPDKEPPFDVPMFLSLSQIRKHPGWQRGIVGPHSTVTNFTVLNGFTGDSLHIPGSWTNTGEFVWGAFVYGDVFDSRPRHVTEFCFVMYKTSMVGDQFAPYGRCNHHNCADEECEAEESQQNPN